MEKNKSFFAMVLAVLFFFTQMVACGTMARTVAPAKSPACAAIPAGASVICEVAAALNVAPEEVARFVKVANVVALASDAYAAAQAMAFLDDVDGYLKVAQESGATYAEAAAMAAFRYEALPPRIKAAILVYAALADPPEALGAKMLTDYDYDLMQAGIADQRKAIKPFL